MSIFSVLHVVLAEPAIPRKPLEISLLTREVLLSISSVLAWRVRQESKGLYESGWWYMSRIGLVGRVGSDEQKALALWGNCKP